MNKKVFSSKGQLLVELLLAIAVAGILLPTIFVGFLSSREGKGQQALRVRASALARAGEEIVRAISQDDWAKVDENGIYHVLSSGGIWSLAAGAETIDEFTRSITISDVMRDSALSIVESGGSVDPSTKKVEVEVAWDAFLPSSVRSIFYITRRENISYTETLEDDFLAGTYEGVAVVNDFGGEIILGAGGSGNWCSPGVPVEELDLPKQGVANAISAIEGKVFAGTGENASGVSYASVDVSASNPPVATLNGTFSGYKTNDIFGDENYAYIATDTNSKEIVVVDLGNQNNGTYSEAGYFNAPGNGDGNSVFVSGDVGFMTSGNKLYSFDLTSKTGSRPLLDEGSLSGTGTSLYVVEGYAYISVANSSQKMQIFDVSNPANINDVGFVNLNGGGGVDVFVNDTGTRAYLATANSSIEEEFHVIDVTEKAGGRPVIGDYETGDMNPKGVTVVTGNKAIIVGTGGEEYQVVNIVSESSPSRCGGVHVDTGVNGVASVLESDGDAYSYIISGDASTELKIIEGGPGGSFSSEGIFESQTYFRPYSTAFNRIYFEDDKLPQTDILYQVAVANPTSGSCSDAVFEFIGPDGTSSSFFSESSYVPFGVYGNFENPGICFKYKTFLSSLDSSVTPIFYEMRVNYTP